MLLYVFIALTFLMLNEYRLIKKYINAINDPENKLEQTKTQKLIHWIVMSFIKIKNWINDKLLNNELTYHS